MPKTTKKTTKKVEVEENVNSDYHIFIKLNDTEFDMDTNDIAESILSVKPEFLKTKLVIQVTKDGKTLDRMLYANEGKKLFYNRFTLESFIKNLIF